jgi:hypothetical protein
MHLLRCRVVQAAEHQPVAKHGRDVGLAVA